MRSTNREQQNELARVVAQAIERRRDAITYELARRFYEKLTSITRWQDEKFPNGWIAIETLSQLRDELGCRLATVKLKWLAAGLPIRKFKGDRAGVWRQDGSNEWEEFVSWMLSQGYEVKGTGDDTDALFFIKKA